MCPIHVKLIYETVTWRGKIGDFAWQSLELPQHALIIFSAFLTRRHVCEEEPWWWSNIVGSADSSWRPIHFKLIHETVHEGVYLVTMPDNRIKTDPAPGYYFFAFLTQALCLLDTMMRQYRLICGFFLVRQTKDELEDMDVSLYFHTRHKGPITFNLNISKSILAVA